MIASKETMKAALEKSSPAPEEVVTSGALEQQCPDPHGGSEVSCRWACQTYVTIMQGHPCAGLSIDTPPDFCNTCYPWEVVRRILVLEGAVTVISEAFDTCVAVCLS